MKSWIAFEHTVLGLPTECCLIVTARTPAEATQLMGTAIAAQSRTATRQNRERLFAIFIEAPRELSADDPRHDLVTDPATPTFLGFDEGLPDNRSRRTPRR
jgi:hypothetical protein